MWIGFTPSSLASSMARSRRSKLLSEYQVLTISALSFFFRPARSVKKPRAWLDQEKFGIWWSFSHFLYGLSEAAMQPAQIGLIISASAKLLLRAPGACFFLRLA